MLQDSVGLKYIKLGVKVGVHLGTPVIAGGALKKVVPANINRFEAVMVMVAGTVGSMYAANKLDEFADEWLDNLAVMIDDYTGASDRVKYYR